MCVILDMHAPLFVLLAAIALQPAAVVSLTHKDAFPPLWHLAPGNIKDYSMKDNKIIIDAWNYEERLGMYKIMLNHSSKYFTAFGPNNVGNLLWGLPLQHGWQYHTGRLAVPPNTTCGHGSGDHLCISVQSWWGCMNYYLAIIPFLGALEAGFFGQIKYPVEMLPPEELREDFCYSVSDCHSQIPKLMDEWKAYFEYLLSAGQTPASIKLDDALNYLWKAHVASIDYALPKFKNRLKYLSGPETNFGENWANGMEFIAATHFPTNLWNTNEYQAFLPPRLLVEGDAIPFIGDFSPEQNKVLLSLCVLHKTNEFTGGAFLAFWRMAMSTEEGRAAGRSLIQLLISSGSMTPDAVGIYKEKYVTITILKLANAGSLCHVGNHFSVDKSTATEAIQEVCLVIQDILANHFICLINLQGVSAASAA
ncbi:LEG1-like protein [Alligator mississippiensis]|uniref:LEG1-like protein n=1 Tax=Alligator mississippiensis TaxID=8496 RepID=A0A151M395_ALLMI|nr:LEG1-like protein [Alligator mississippiensis]